jgi:hypothetical protein
VGCQRKLSSPSSHLRNWKAVKEEPIAAREWEMIFGSELNTGKA